MTDEFMSKGTAELVVLLLGDGVDDEELTALVSSAFSDGVNFAISRLGEMDGQGES